MAAENSLITSCMQALEGLDLSDYGSDFLQTWDKSDGALQATINLAELLEELHRQKRSFKPFDSGLAISIFRDQSTRTRFSFASAASALGLTVTDLDEEKSQIAHGETVRETANMISFLAEVVGIRDDIYLNEGHRTMREFAAAVDEGFKEGILHQRPAVINLQCDRDHPTQSLADIVHLKKHFGSLENLKGKRIVMSWAYSPSYGKPLSVPQGIIGLMTRFGMDVRLAYPEGYSLIPDLVDLAEKNARKSGGSFKIYHDMGDAFYQADVVYPKSWAPYQIMEQRTELLKKKDRTGLKDLEQDCLKINARHRDWECDAEKMNLTKNRQALYMHCLPADISGVSCERGEVSKDVFEKYRLATYKEASFKPFVIAAMIFLSRIDNPLERIGKILANKRLNR